MSSVSEGRTRHVWILAAAVFALLAAAALRVVPVSDAALAMREERFLHDAGEALDADGRRMAEIASRLQDSTALSEVVDAGGAEVRPAKLFSILAAALPPEPGWGILFEDATGRAVGWAGEPVEIEEDLGRADGGIAASFHSVRFTVARSSVRVVAGERRGLLVVSRRYPTGLLRPDLIEFFGLPGSPTRVRIHAAASGKPGRLVRLFSEPSVSERLRDDATRARARIPSAVAAALWIVFGLAAGRLAPALLLSRAALLLGAPRAGSGIWRSLGPSDSLGAGFLATPADVFLTGLLALVLLRIAWSLRRRREGSGPILFLAGLPLALLPYLLGRTVGETFPGFFTSMDLLPESLASFLLESGGLLLATASVGATALLWSRLSGKLRPGVVLAVAAALLVAAGGSEATRDGALLAGLGATALGFVLGHRARDDARRDLLGRAATAAFLAAAAAASAGVGLSHGKMRRIDAALEEADGKDPGADAGAAVRAWEERVHVFGPEIWLPAGRRTLVSDLARALFIRGASERFPGPGDVLRLRDAGGNVVSAFGLTRPGAESRGTLERARLPLPFAAEWVRVPWPRESDRDPLLADVAGRHLLSPVLVERLEYDAAGRASGATRADPVELPERLREEVRRKGLASSRVFAAEGLRRLRVRDRSPGFVAYVATGEPVLVSLGAAVAAAESSLPIVFLVLLLGRGVRASGARRGPFLRTYRARLVALVVLFGALPLAGSVVVIRLALDRHSTRETVRRARNLLAEGRRALDAQGGVAGPDELNRAAAVLGSDLFLYRDGARSFASRALPVTAEVAEGRLEASVAEALAEGKREASSPVLARTRSGPRVVHAAEALDSEARDSLAVVVAEDETARGALDAIVLFAVAVALLAFGFGGRAALALGKPIEDLIGAAEQIGSGAAPLPLEPPRNVDLRRLVEAFEAMGARVRERTESLARERETAVGLLANLTAAVLLFRRSDGTILLSNPAADELIPGSGLPEKLRDPSWQPVREIVEEATRRHMPVERRVAVAAGGKRGVFRVVAMELSPDESGPRALLLLEDLTEFVRADRLGAWVDAARAVAHDVKNPLTPVRLAAERLLRLSAREGGVPAGDVAEAGSGILRQVAILTERIGRLARFSDPAALEPRPLDAAGVKALLSGLASDYSGIESVRLVVEAAEDLPMVAADPVLVRDALTNLVVNALEAIGPKGGTIRLTAVPARLTSGAAGIRFACADDGPGLTREGLDRLFEPAFSTKSRGSGVGLATVRRSVERHGGSVFAEPAEGGGLVVGFVLPAL